MLSCTLRADAKELQTVGNFTKALFFKIFELALEQTGVYLYDVVAFLAQKMMMVVVGVQIVQAILGGVLAEKTFLYDVDFLKLMKGPVDSHQVAFTRLFAFFELGHDFFGGLRLRRAHQAIDDFRALVCDFYFVFTHFREDSLFRR